MDAKLLKLITVVILFLLFNLQYIMHLDFASAQSITSNQNFNTTSVCNCVVLRLDDVRDDWLTGVQLDILNQFIEKNQSLSLGIIMHKINNNTELFSKVDEGRKDGLFELDVHGWDHVDFSKLSRTQQISALEKSKNTMYDLFGTKPDIFIAPYNAFDNDTLYALNSTGFRIFSSSITSDKDVFTGSNNENQNTGYQLYHMPEMFSFMGEKNGVWFDVPAQKILDNIDADIHKYGYSVIVLHPQNFAKFQNGTYVNVVDPYEMDKLNYLIYSIEMKHIHITTFSNVLHQIDPQETMQSVPEFDVNSIYALMLSSVVTIFLPKFLVEKIREKNRQ